MAGVEGRANRWFLGIRCWLRQYLVFMDRYVSPNNVTRSRFCGAAKTMSRGEGASALTQELLCPGMREDCCRGNKKSPRKHEHSVLAFIETPDYGATQRCAYPFAAAIVLADPPGSIVADEGGR